MAGVAQSAGVLPSDSREEANAKITRYLLEKKAKAKKGRISHISTPKTDRRSLSEGEKKVEKTMNQTQKEGLFSRFVGCVLNTVSAVDRGIQLGAHVVGKGHGYLDASLDEIKVLGYPSKTVHEYHVGYEKGYGLKKSRLHPDPTSDTYAAFDSVVADSQKVSAV